MSRNDAKAHTVIYRYVKILLVTGSYPPVFCGVGDYSARLAVALRDAGADLQVLTTHQPDLPAGDPTWVRREMPSWNRDSLPQFRAVLKAFQPDIVHVQYPTQGYDNGAALALLMLMACAFRKFAVVSTWHEYPPDEFTRAKVCQMTLALISRAIVVVRPDYPPRVRGLLAAALAGAPIRFIPNASVIPRVTLTEGERAALRRQLCGEDRQLVAFFGFVYPHKGVEQIFDIADPARHHLVLIGNLTQSDPYHVRLRSLADSERWRGHVTITGFVDQQHAARYLAVSDAVVLPFLEGGGHWNSSLHAAMTQGTFVIATSADRAGYDPGDNVYYAAPGAVPEMAAALRQYAGTRASGGDQWVDPWTQIAQAHLDLYRKCFSRI